MARKTENPLGTWESPKHSGIRIRALINRHSGETFGASYIVTLPAKLTGTTVKRKQFRKRAKAEQWADEQFRGARKEGETYFSLTDAERREIVACLPDLRAHGIRVGEAIRFAVKGLKPLGRTKTLPQVVEELDASKKQRFERGDLRESSYQDFRHRGDRLSAGFTGRLIAEVTGEEIKTWLKGLEIGPRSNQNYLAAIGEIFKFATQKRYIAASPLDHLTDVDRKELCGRGAVAREPSILTPDEAERMLNAALQHPELGLLAPITLILFCGVRTEEAKRLSWDSVRLDETPPVIIIGSKIAKKRSIRHAEITPTALAWLALVPDRTGQVTRNINVGEYQHRFKRLVKFAKFESWESNAMRHSFGSYHYALHGNSMETARLLGHRANDQVMFDHYRALATKDAAQKYFAIRPPATAGKVVQFA